jgi:hypothetical protein
VLGAAALIVGLVAAPAGASARTGPGAALCRVGGWPGGIGAVIARLLHLPPSACAPTTPAGPTVVATGLNNPRHLSFSRSGDLYVAEAGTGGDGPCIDSSDGSHVCYGATGSITEVTARGAQKRVVTGLPSLAATGGASATGPSDVDIVGDFGYVVSIGLGAPPADRADLPAGADFGDVVAGSLRRQPNSWRVIADISAYEDAHNPVDTKDSNPASVLRQGAHYIVADAGANTVLDANARTGAVKLVAALPNIPNVPEAEGGMQAVPTSVEIGPDGAYYISQLTGFPFPVGGSVIWRVVPGHAPQQYATGLTNVTDLAFGPDGTLYAVEITAAGLLSGNLNAGAVVAIAPRTHTQRIVADNLFAPYGIALRGGYAYVTTGSVAPGGGQVLRIPLR